MARSATIACSAGGVAGCGCRMIVWGAEREGVGDVGVSAALGGEAGLEQPLIVAAIAPVSSATKVNFRSGSVLIALSDKFMVITDPERGFLWVQ